MYLFIKEPPAGKRFGLVFICVPVSPGNSRLIWVFPRNFGIWIDKIVPRWMFHVGQNLVLDSDLYLLHVEVTNKVIILWGKIRNYFPSKHMIYSFYPILLDLIDSLTYVQFPFPYISWMLGIFDMIWYHYDLLMSLIFHQFY